MSSVISRDSFYCPEIEIFYAVKNWHDNYYQNQKDEWKPNNEIVSKIRLTLMSMTELLKIVRYSNLFDLNHILDAIEVVYGENNLSIDANNKNNDKNYRGRLSK